MFRANLFLLVVITLFQNSLFSQIIKIDPINTNDSTLYKINGQFGINFSATNRDQVPLSSNNLINLRSSLDLSYQDSSNYYKFINVYDYLSIANQNILNSGYSHIRVTHNHLSKIYQEGFIQYQFDAGRGLKWRLLSCAYLGKKISSNKKSTKIKSALGVMYEVETWNNVNTEADTLVNFLKLATYLALHQKINEQIHLNFISYYQVGYDSDKQMSRQRLFFNTNFAMKINKKFTFNLEFNSLYDPSPITPILNFVYTISNGVIFKF